MIDADNTLAPGERLLGRYTVVLLQHTQAGGWQPSLMQLDAQVTNYRLMLRPMRKKYPPASLPSTVITRLALTRQSRYHCVAVSVNTGHWLYMTLSTGRLEHLYEDLHAMKQPPPRFRFDDRVAKADILRLITFFGRAPLPDGSAPD